VQAWGAGSLQAKRQCRARVLTLANLQKNGLMSRAHDVWNGAAAGKTADMRGVDIPRLSAFNMVD